jgi:HK97 family phage major capsid protein
MSKYIHPAALNDDGLRAEITRLAELDNISRADDNYLSQLAAELEFRNDPNPTLEASRARAMDRLKNDPGVEYHRPVTTFQHQRKVDPDAAAGSPAEARDIALAALERAGEIRQSIDGVEPRQDLRGLFERSAPFSEYFAATASPDYLQAFGKMLQAGDPGRASMIMSDAERDAMRRVSAAEVRAVSLVDTSGGFAVPQLLDPSIMLTNAGVVNPIRSVARSVTGISDKWTGISSDGITAAWYAEGAEVTDDAPTLAQPTIEAHKAAAFVPYSVEIESDWVSMVRELGRSLFDAKDRLEGEAFVNGSGSGAPFGVVTRIENHTNTAPIVRYSTTTAGTFDADEVRALFAALPPRFRQNAAWASSISVANQVRALGDDKLGNQTVALTDGYSFPVLGRPWLEVSDMDEMVSGTAAATLAVVGDWSNFIIFDRIGTARLEIVPHLFGSNNRPTGQRGVYFWWRVGSDVYTARNTGEIGFRALVNKTS